MPGDRFTALKPVYKIQELGKDAFECKLEMPTTCPLRTTITVSLFLDSLKTVETMCFRNLPSLSRYFTEQGCPMPRKNLSKMAAAYQACKKLYVMGELAGNLLPVVSESDDESETEEEVEPGSDGKKKTKAGTKKRKRVYNRKVFL